GIDPDGHVVFSDAFLSRDGRGDDLHVDLLHAVADRPDQVQPGAARPRQHPPEPEYDALLVLLHDLDRGAGRDEPGHDEYPHDDHQGTHRPHLFSIGAAVAV